MMGTGGWERVGVENVGGDYMYEVLLPERANQDHIFARGDLYLLTYTRSR